MINKKKNSIIYTNKAICKDCYRCIRACPVNAIRINSENQASIISEKCIACGICINECPQQAKAYRNDIAKLIGFINSDEKIAFSIAPSFASIYEDWEVKRIASALRQIGAVYVGETAYAAYFTANEINEIINDNSSNQLICSACPAVNSYIEKYEPSLISKITPICSPMIAHARLIKQKMEDVKVAFIGPCTAKKDEAEKAENKNIVDIVLTFEELNQLFLDFNINLKQCEEGQFDDIPDKNARLFPLEGGLLKTANLTTDVLSKNHITLSGVDELKDAIKTLKTTDEDYLVEALFCKYGCINGPASNLKKSNFEKRSGLIEFSKSTLDFNSADLKLDENIFKAEFSFKNLVSKKKFSEEEIQQKLNETGKANPQNQLNCGACGYDNCREQIVAVLEGVAQVDMCIPYMRRIAEQKSDLILKSDPNGVVILDEKLNIVSMNPSFKKMFMCTDAICGKKISYLFDPDAFEKVLLDSKSVVKKKVKYDSYNLICYQTHYCIEETQQIVGIFSDITSSEHNQESLKVIKRDTILSAQDLIEHQVEMAQQMAKFLGESTAKGEMLLNNFIDTLDNK